MVDINATMPLIEPLGATVNYLMAIVKILVGGFFGLYLFAFIYKIFAFRKLSKQMHELFDELVEIKKRLGKLERKKGKR